MNIYIIGQKGIPSKGGGVEKHVEMLSKYLVNNDNKVFVYTRSNYTKKSLKSFNGVKLISLPSIKSKHLEAISHTFLALLDLIRRKPDIIHFHSIGPSSLIWFAKLLKPNTPIITTFHCQDYYHKKWNLLARIYLKFGELLTCKLPEKTITVSKNLARYTYKKYKKIATYIPNGVEIIKHEPVDIIKSKWGLSKNSYILSVSRLIEHKGIHYLIEAFSKLKTNKKLVITGDGYYTDKYVLKLKQLAKNNANIIFTGNQGGKSLRELFTNTYLFVQPSTSEGLSIALLEAMASKNAVLVSDIKENKEVIGRTNFSFKNKNVLSLQQKLNYLLKNKNKIQKEKLKSIKRIKSEYNWQTITNDTIKTYRNAIFKKQSKINVNLINSLMFQTNLKSKSRPTT